ncbi:unnamed protein product [Dicrocoelium dendriticum]|nr:unnamed protein product [Dicrocoelium dendriticum]
MSQESLLSYCSNISSISRSYRAQYGSTAQSKTAFVGNPRLASASNSSSQNDHLSNTQVLQRLVREKEEHIGLLLQERDMERSDLAKATLDRQLAETMVTKQQGQIEHLSQQLMNVEASHRILEEERDQLLSRLLDKKKALEDLQFRMEEEKITKSTLECMNAEDESKIFELEEALISAREINERTEAELHRLRAELATALSRHAQEDLIPDPSETTVQTSPHEEKIEDPLNFTPPKTKDAKVGSSRKPSLNQDNLVSHFSVAPHTVADPTLQTELERLRRELSVWERIAEFAVRRQADTLDITKADYEQQLSDLQVQLLSASQDLLESQKRSSLQSEAGVSDAGNQGELDALKANFAEERNRSSEQIAAYQKYIAELSTELARLNTMSSDTASDQTSGLRKLEEQLKLADQQLTKLRNTTLVSAESFLNDQKNQVAALEGSESIPVSPPSQLKEQDAILQLQMNQLEVICSGSDWNTTSKLESDTKQAEMEAIVDGLRTELLLATRKQDELASSLEIARASKDQLVAELFTLLDEPFSTVTPSIDTLITGIRMRIQNLSTIASEAEVSRQVLNSRILELEEERAELIREFTLLKSSASATETEENDSELKKQLEAAQLKITHLEASANAALGNLETKSSELCTLQEQLEKTQTEFAQLHQTHMKALASLEAENAELLRQIQLAESSGHTTSTPGDGRGTLPSEEHEALTSQIAFLNSIIVDLHKKNAELEERLRQTLVDVEHNSA